MHVHSEWDSSLRAYRVVAYTDDFVWSVFWHTAPSSLDLDQFRMRAAIEYASHRDQSVADVMYPDRSLGRVPDGLLPAGSSGPAAPGS